jgi:hypothetical protein
MANLEQTAVQTHLIDLACDLDKMEKFAEATAIDQILFSGAMKKVAQYVGVIGYVLKQDRAMGNCIRKKRTTASGPMQEVIMDCIKEYQDGQDYDNNEWTSKYAQVIQQIPDKNTCSDFLNILGKENEIAKHAQSIIEAQKKLASANIQDDVINEVIAKIKQYARFFQN